MTKAPDVSELIPSAKRIVTSLRDLGYHFSAAVADIIDNSVAAKAKEVFVDIEFDGDDSWVRILDDGTGMEKATLFDAMRYGSEREYTEDDLGKFGLGLKTASFSQCRRLTVASRLKTKQQRFVALQWDLEHIQKTDRWEVLTLHKDSLHREVSRYLDDEVGTVVFWERLDRILGYERPYGEFARKRLLHMCRELEQHLGMVFHRFLSGETKDGRKLKLFVNNNPVAAWDPFAREEPKIKEFPAITLPLQSNLVLGKVVLHPFVLPHQNDFRNPTEHAIAAGPKKWNRQQGFYIYRADRMIQGGGWCNLRTLDEHTKLARIGLSFSPKLDEAFKINVAKMRVQLPSEIVAEIENRLAPVISMAQQVYRKGGQANLGKHGKSDKRPEESIANLDGAGYRLLNDICNQLYALADEGDRKLIMRLFKRLSRVVGKKVKIRHVHEGTT